LFYLGEVRFQGHGRRRGCGGKGILAAAKFDVVVDTIDTVRLYVEFVIAQLVQYIEDDEQTGGDAQRQTEYIDDGESFIFKQTTKRGF
jgi:hypothetical protein